jgi:hypothetical protein
VKQQKVPKYLSFMKQDKDKIIKPVIDFETGKSRATVGI